MGPLIPVRVDAVASKNCYRVGEDVLRRVHAVAVPLALDPASKCEEVALGVQVGATVVGVHGARSAGVVRCDEVASHVVGQRDDGRLLRTEPHVCQVGLPIPVRRSLLSDGAASAAVGREDARTTD